MLRNIGWGIGLLGCLTVAAAPTPLPDQQVHYLLPGKSLAQPLEKMATEIKTRSKVLGYGGAESVYRVKGKKSAIRLKKNASVVFVVRGVPQTIDPGMMVKLFRFEGKKNRELLLAKSTASMSVGGVATVGGKVTRSDGEGLPLTFVKLGDTKVKITPTEKLPPGEYGFAWVAPSPNVYCFGVDE